LHDRLKICFVTLKSFQGCHFGFALIVIPACLVTSATRRGENPSLKKDPGQARMTKMEKLRQLAFDY